MRALPILLALLSASCAGVGVSGAAPQSLRWVKTNGIAIQVPADWQVDAAAGQLRAHSPDRRELIAIEAIPTAATQDAGALLRSLVEQGKLGPLISPSILAIRGNASTTQAQIKGRHAGGPALAHALLALRGGAATLYLAAASESNFPARLPQLVKILQSFSFEQNATAPAAPGLQFVRVEEPQERAYSLEFPAGWRTEVLLQRLDTNQKRTEASAVEPQRQATIFLGDRNVGSYSVPTQFMASLGFREGMMYRPSATTAMLLLRYLPGAQFGPYWMQQRLPQARQLALRERPDLAQRLSAQRYALGNVLNAQLHVGEMDFEYQGQRGTLLVGTEIFGCEHDACIWSVPYFYGYFATPERQEEARAALAHAVGSSRINPQWWIAENRQQAINHEIALKGMQAVNQIFRDTMAQRSESMDRINRVRGDLLSGTYRVVDPTTNEQTTVQAGSNFYYRLNNTNTVIGAQIEQSPVDLTKMLILDWDVRP